MKLYLGAISGLLAVFSQIFLSEAALAQSATERAICSQNGEYATFAQHPILGGEIGQRGSVMDNVNLQRVHEHIFFCKNGRIVDNVGWNFDSKRFSYSSQDIRNGREPQKQGGGRVDDFVPIDNERYDSDIVRLVLGSTRISSSQCTLRQGDGVYVGVINNCQGFTARIREEYWRKMFIGTWEGQFPCGSGRYILEYAVDGNSLVQKVIQHGGEKCLPNGHISTIAYIPNNVSKGSSFSSVIHLGTGSQTITTQIAIIDANTFNFGGTILRRVQ
ncbi:hypothetical protein NO108_03664 [Planktothrix rubescens]|nr:hypothetical protein NO108_03664 [Planktothrix rubescens]